MSDSFRSAGVKDVSPFSADLDPNTTPPPVARIIQIPDRTVNGRLSRDVKFYPVFTNPAASPDIDLTVWQFDERNSNWVKATAITGLDETLPGAQVSNLAPSRLFFQITALNVGTADFVEIFAAPI